MSHCTPFIARKTRFYHTACKCVAFAMMIAGPLSGQQAAPENPRFYIREYRVDGVKVLKNLEVEEAVYPFLGPSRTPDDVEQARQTLEKAYHAKGFQTVSVSIPQQDPRRGIIRLQVTEGKIARLRVNGSRWFLPSRIKSEVPSVAEGSVPNFNNVTKEIIGVNRLADRRITPELKAGMEPGTFDVDLKVEDKLPLHGSLELNNRYSANTTQLRINGSLSYANLFQLGHTLGTSFQIAPENIDDSLSYSAFYLARVTDGLSLMLQGTKQDSNVSTLGGAAVAGAGEIVGFRALFDLPTTQKFYQSINLGIDYKNLQEDTIFGIQKLAAPIIYFPISANYSAGWIADNHFTEVNASLGFQLRGLGSPLSDYANKRYKSTGNYMLLRGDVAHTHDVFGDFQLYGKLQGQVADQPLINSEQIAGGGLDTVRGYLEATALGDNGVFGKVEFRSPSLFGKPSAEEAKNPANELRFYTFSDAGIVGIYDALPGQDDSSPLASVGIGTRLRFQKHYHASADVALPLIEQPDTNQGEIRVTFRGWADF
ncbi:MAG: ShlB/FhaC/HecB family hemolysin secretion/activation protein [Gloeobacteraceae cyanobacterium ES-bin-144]|nr:ShlB/FhaC/HecB family hemolysin secretion/activation protein [Verrucomicrobiales bacterium]